MTKRISLGIALSLGVASLLGLAGMQAPAAAESWAELVKAAEKEGEVAVAGPVVKAHRETISLFQKAYPNIKLKYTGVTPGTFEPRVRAERKAGEYLWDVHIGGVSSLIYSRQIPSGWYDSIRDAIRPELAKDEIWLGGFDSSFLDKEKKYVFAFTGELSESVFVNWDFVKKEDLKVFEDLLKPQFKGKISIRDPRKRNAGSNSFTRLMLVMGKDKAAKLLSDQDVAISQTPRQVAEWLVRGRYPISIGGNRTNIVDFQKRGIGKNITPLPDYRAQTVTPAWGGMLLMNKAPHPAAARLFINWMLGPEPQADWAKRGARNSRRVDVPKGDKPTAPDAKAWLTGLNLNTEKRGPDRLEGLKLAREALKNKK